MLDSTPLMIVKAAITHENNRSIAPIILSDFLSDQMPAIHEAHETSNNPVTTRPSIAMLINPKESGTNKWASHKPDVVHNP